MESLQQKESIGTILKLIVGFMSEWQIKIR